MLVATTPASAPQAPDPEAPARFIVMYRGVQIGSETVRVQRPGGTMRILSTGMVAAPVDLVTTAFEMTYDSDWQPQRLRIDASLHAQPIQIGTDFGVTTATSEVVQAGRPVRGTHTVSPRAIVLALHHFAAYEILAARLPSMAVGTAFPVYIAPETEVRATLNRVVPRRMVNPDGALELQEYEITLHRPGQPLQVQVLVDAARRLARVTYRDQSLVAIRSDIGGVMTREERVRNTGDTPVFIGAAGFNLAATITPPAAATGRAPAVILMSGAGRQDREETLYGVSIFGQLAGRLSEAGYFVVRYDKRGVGQSGGRPEHAGLAEFASDAIDVVSWLRRRRDVDADRIAVVSHAEGAAIALTAAGRERRIRGVAMLAPPGRTGRETVLAQQRLELDRLDDAPAEREAKVALQRRIIDAALTGQGWDALPADVRRQADSPWFKSWLQFDPADALRRVSQPLLILHGALDRQMTADHGERLEQLARARRQPPTHTVRVVVPGVNHLLVAATSGEPEEYALLSGEAISPAVVSAIVDWLSTTLKR